MKLGIKKIFIYNFLILITTIYIVSCATVVSPSGGPTDKQPPKVVKSSVENKSVNFNDNKIIIEFDEYFTLLNLEKQLITSPIIIPAPEIKVKKKKLLINFKNKLQPNTTYNIYFGDAISDINENNKLNNFNFAFSTGTFIDSLSVKGNVKDAFTLEPVSDIYVMLYSDFSDTAFFKTTPKFVTKTDNSGNFEINNIAEGNYKMFALGDANGDYIYNMPNEKIAFIEDSISPSRYKDTISDSLQAATIQPIELFAFTKEDTIQRIEKKNMLKTNLLQIIFKKRVEGLNITSNLNKDNVLNFKELSRTKDTLNIWFPEKYDNLELVVSAKEMSNDTIKINKLFEMIAAKNSQETKFALSYATNLYNSRLQFGSNLILTFSNPISKCNFDSIFLINLDKKDTIVPQMLWIDSLNRRLSIAIPTITEENQRLLIPKGQIEDIFKNDSDTIKITFSASTKEQFGSLKIDANIENCNTQVIVQLVNSQNKVLKEFLIQENAVLDFRFLEAGKYKLKAIIDSNMNGYWDTGDYNKKTQPEKVIFFNKEIDIRANWDLIETWSIEKKP